MRFCDYRGIMTPAALFCLKREFELSNKKVVLVGAGNIAHAHAAAIREMEGVELLLAWSTSIPPPLVRLAYQSRRESGVCHRAGGH